MKKILEHPRVFISYSHDNEEHKAQIRQIGDWLREQHGIDVVADFYDEDISYGELLNKFMESGINECDKVLVILTRKYKIKADEGEGGVGYESIILTEKIFDNIQTNKIIPIVLEDKNIDIKTYAPKFLTSLRKAILRNSFPDEVKFREEIARAILEVPKKPKPPLGKSPLLNEKIGVEHVAARIDINTLIQDDKVLYENAYFYAETNKKKEYKQLLYAVKVKVFESLRVLREEQEKNFNAKNNKDLILIMDRFVDIVRPLLLIALAGVASGHEDYKHQKGLLFDLLGIDDWYNRAGATYIKLQKVPKFLGFVYHHLYGALLIYQEDHQDVWNILEQKVPNEAAGDFKFAYNVDSIAGWVDSLGRDCFESFRFLLDAYKRWSWLAIIFPSEDEYKTTLVIYQNIINLYGFFTVIRDKVTIEHDETLIPPSFIIADRKQKEHAKKWLVKNSIVFKKLLAQTGLSNSEIRKAWRAFLEQISKYRRERYFFSNPYDEKDIEYFLE